MAADLRTGGVDRRLFLTAALATLLAAAEDARGAGAALEGALPAEALSFVALLAETLIPRTDTPGAADAGVPAFIDGLIARISTPAERLEAASRIAGLEAAFDRLAGARFRNLPAAEQLALLEAIDLEAVSQAPGSRLAVPSTPPRYLSADDADLYRRLRALIVFAYFTSEVGATQTLEFLPAPGEWAADIPLDPAQRNYFNVDRSFDPTVVGMPADGV